MSDVAFTLVTAPLAALTVAAALLEAAAGPRRRARAVDLAARAAGRLGLRPPADPTVLELPAVAGAAPVTLRYHLAPTQEEDAAITLVAAAGGRRLGAVLVDSDPARLVVPGLRRLPLGPAFDGSFRVFVEPDRAAGVLVLLRQDPEVARRLRDLATRTRTCRLELADQGGVVKVRYRDRRLRFPSDVEAVSVGLVALHAAWTALAGDRREAA